MAKHKHWLKQNDLLYTHEHKFVVVSAHPVNGKWIVRRINANDYSLLTSKETKAEAQRFMVDYVRSHPNG